MSRRPVICHPDRPSVFMSSVWAKRCADHLCSAVIWIPAVAGAPAQHTAGVAERYRHDGDPIVGMVVCCPVARPKEFGAILLAQPLIFLQRLLVVIRRAVFAVEGPWFRRMLGTELRDPAIGELGKYEGTVTGGVLL